MRDGIEHDEEKGYGKTGGNNVFGIGLTVVLVLVRSCSSVPGCMLGRWLFQPSLKSVLSQGTPVERLVRWPCSTFLLCPRQGLPLNTGLLVLFNLPEVSESGAPCASGLGSLLRACS